MYLVGAVIVALLIVYLQRSIGRADGDDGEEEADEAVALVPGARDRGARARLRNRNQPGMAYDACSVALGLVEHQPWFAVAVECRWGRGRRKGGGC